MSEGTLLLDAAQLCVAETLPGLMVRFGIYKTAQAWANSVDPDYTPPNRSRFVHVHIQNKYGYFRKSKEFLGLEK